MQGHQPGNTDGPLLSLPGPDQLLPAADAAIACNDVEDASLRLSSVYNSNRLRLADRADGFRMRYRSLRMGRLDLATLSFGAAVDIEQSGDRPFLLVTTQLHGHSRVQTSGSSAEGGRGFIVVDSAGQQVSKHFSADSARCNVRIDQTLLEARCAALLQRPLAGPLRFAPFAANRDPVRQRWLALLHLLLSHAHSPVPPHLAPLLGSLEDAVLLHLLLEHPHNYSEALGRPAGSIAPRHVKRAEAFIREHAHEALKLEDIARAADCSVRALTEGFRRSRDISPMNFLRQVRLEGVRLELQRAADGSCSITDVALRWGFGHLGRFALDYRRQFGERPSDTLRRHG